MRRPDEDPSGSPEPDAAPRRRRRRGVWAIAAFVLTVVMLAAAVGAYSLTSSGAPGGDVEVEVPGGASTSAIASALSEAGVISSPLVFRVLAKVRGLDGKLKAGRYTLRRGMGPQAALDALRAGPELKTVPVTIPEGYTVKQVAARVGARTHITEAAFSQAAQSGTIRAAIQPASSKSLEGLLFPDTYTVDERTDAAGLVRRMVQTFEEVTSGLDWTVPESKGLSRYQALVIASLVEREAKVPEDRAKVAAVVYNRLAKGMRLEIDATVLYDLPAHKVPTRADLRRDSPYNTYLRAGLPPTPIANPGLEAIRATLAPAAIDALYYVVIDPSGRHGFTSSYAEFQRMLKLRPPETRGGRATATPR